ncbi:MAG TPA: HYR domain-containing protein [Chitinophagaceae bacterium]|nr:HYR domain-containing protein [Chitinophagaceae bacterium]
MRKFYFLLLTFLFAVVSNSQNVNVTGAASGNGSYATLGAAFTAINAGAQTGAVIIIDIVGGTTEAATASLNAGTWTSITISPSGGASRTITGNIAGPLVEFNGADNVTINGLNTGGNSLTLSNTSTSNLTNTSTLRLVNDASGNVVTNCTLNGSSTSVTLGTIFFSTGTSTGNDNNTISNCTITAAGANLPTNALFAAGTSSFENSGNIINNCSISDFFSATLVSAGVLVSANNTDWTISNNKFYQTGTRTYTTANTHRAIQVTSGNNYVISGNTIGYSSAAATGTYTMAGTIATRFIGIDLAVGTTATTSVQGNTVTAINLATSSGAATVNGVLCGINITSGNVNIGNLSSNTIGAASGTGALVAVPTTTQGAVVGISSASTGTILIQNNIIGSFTSSNATTATIAGAVFGITVTAAATSITISGNTIGNATAENMRAGIVGFTTGSSQAAGINVSTTPVSISMTGNTIQNLSSYGTATSGFVRGIMGSTAVNTTATYIVSQNTITNLITSGATTGYTSGNCSAQGIQFSGGANGICSQNLISNISNVNAAATNNMVVAGIILASGANSSAFGNRIWNLSNAGTGTTVTGPPVVAGIIVRSGTTAVSVYNNMISIGEGQTTNTCFLGIMLNHGSTPDPVDNIYFNSITVSGTAASGALISSCMNRGDLTATARNQTVDIKNNIFINTRTGGTGAHYAISNNPNATSSATGWSSNYNILNAAPGTIGYWTTSQTFAGWQAASGGDANSISGGTINFVNSAIADLHITTPYPSLVEGAGVNIPAITSDFDGQARAGLSPVDIGADAGDFSNSPSISLTPLSNICTPGARTLSATIIDPDGVPTSGIGLPVLYWRINAGAYTAATSTFISGNQYNFTFGAGAVVGDVISYYIVAQDNSGNAGSSPLIGAAGFTINPPAAATPPSSPYSYSLTQTLSGTYTVGVGGNFTTLTAAAAAYSTSCLGGPIIFSLTDATYPSETFPINFNSNPEANAVNTLLIKPTGNTVISGSTLSTILQFNGTDYITIDGSTGSIVNSICPPVAATRNLTIQNTNTTSFAAVVWFNSVTTAPVNGVTNCTIKNCIVIGGSNVNTAAGIGIGALPLISGGIDNDFNRVENNDIRLCRFGIYVVGQSGTNKNEGNVITQNIMTSASPNNIGEGGIFSAFENNLTVSGNEVDNIIRTGSPDSYGINLGFGITGGIGTGSAAIADAIGNATITFNKIGIITNSGTFAAAGIALGNTVSGTQLIANNTVSGVAANGTATDFSVGLWLEGGTGTTNVYNNTVAMQGTQPGASSGTQTSAALGIRTLATPVNINNNIFSNTQIGAAAGTTTRFVSVALGYSAPYTGLNSNYNDLYAAGAGPGTYHLGLTGGVGSAGTSRPTLAAWQTETGGDGTSKNVLPVFVSATDLHLVPGPLGTNWCLNGSGLAVASVTNDIDCQARNNPPDIGADEFVPVGDATATPSSQTICSGNAITTIVLAGTSTSFNWTRNNNVTVTGIAASGTGNISGTLTNTTAAPVTVTFTITPVDASGCFGTPITATVLVNPQHQVSGSVTQPTTCVSADGAINITMTGSPGPYTFAWTTNGGSGLNPTSEDQTGLTIGQYTVVVTDQGTGCPQTAIFTLLGPGGCAVCPTIGAVSATPSPACANNNITFSATGLTNMGVTYGITFKYSASALANPYVGGTVFATVPNGSLGGGGTTASATGTIAVPGNYFIYAILSTTPLDPTCRPSASSSLVVNQAPTVVCPANITVSNAANQCGNTVTYSTTVTGIPAPTQTYSFTGATTGSGSGNGSGSFFNKGVTTVTVTVTNSCGTANCSFTVTVNDTQNPSITCPAGVTVSCASAVPAPNIASVTASDNCPGVVVTHQGDVISGQTCANRYTITRTYRATDASGNIAQCTQTITVNDITAPTLTCPANVTVSCASAVPVANIASVTGVTDNCGGVVTVTHQGDVISAQTCVNRYTITRTYRATDACGNFAQCTQTITVNDQTAPVVTCPANITVTTPVGSCTAVVTYTPTATDNCAGAVTIVSIPASGFAFPIGTTTVNVTATDACGNSSTCSFTVTVNNAQLAAITSQPQNTTVCDGSNAVFSVTASTSPSPGPLNYQWEQWNGSAWVNIAGATASNLTVSTTTVAMNTNTYRVRVIGLCNTVISNAATLFVNTLPNVSITSSIPPQIQPGQMVTLTASGSPGGGSYQWYRNNIVIPAANTNTLVNLTINDLGTYRVVYTDLNGCVNTSANVVLSASQSSLLYVYPNPNNGRFHVRFYNSPNEQVNVNVFAANGALVYRKAFTGSLPYTDFEINLFGRPAGIYIVEVRGEGGKLIGTKKVRIQMQ